MDVPEGVDIRTVLQTLFENDAPNIPEAAAAQPEDPGMLTTDALQPTFPPEALISDILMGRSIFMRVFPQYFTNGQGGHEQAPEELRPVLYQTRLFRVSSSVVRLDTKLYSHTEYFNS